MGSRYNESTVLNEVLHGETYDVLTRKLNKDQRNLSNLTLGDYKVIRPIYIDGIESFRYTEGWLCLNTKTNKYKIS